MHAVGDHRDGQHIGVGRGDSEDTDKAMLDGRTVAVFLSDHHDVRIDGVSQIGGCGGLREDQ